MREYFIQNALYWFGTFHVDALRIDAVHAMNDASAWPFLEEPGERVEDFAGENFGTGEASWIFKAFRNIKAGKSKVASPGGLEPSGPYGS